MATDTPAPNARHGHNGARPTPTRRGRRRLRARIDGLLDTIEMPVPFDIGALCHTLSERRGRAIQLMPTSTIVGTRPMPFSGLWIAAPTTDYLFYDDSTAPLHAENSVLHELGHMVLDHRRDGEIDDKKLTLLQALFPHFTRDVLRALGGSTLGRAGYSRQEEYEAEMFAARVWKRAGPARTLVHVAPRGADDGERRVLRRLGTLLGPWARDR